MIDGRRDDYKGFVTGTVCYSEKRIESISKVNIE